MRQNKIQNERTNEKTNQRKLVNPTKKEWYWHVAQFGVGCLLLFFAVNVPVFAAGNVDTSQITGGFDSIYQVIAAIVSAIGSIFLFLVRCLPYSKNALHLFQILFGSGSLWLRKFPCFLFFHTSSFFFHHQESPVFGTGTSGADATGSSGSVG